ncbi:hypothetical protein B296_00010203, partial [Ensete ventricosum]
IGLNLIRLIVVLVVLVVSVGSFAHRHRHRHRHRGVHTPPEDTRHKVTMLLRQSLLVATSNPSPIPRNPRSYPISRNLFSRCCFRTVRDRSLPSLQCCVSKGSDAAAVEAVAEVEVAVGETGSCEAGGAGSAGVSVGIGSPPLTVGLGLHRMSLGDQAFFLLAFVACTPIDTGLMKFLGLCPSALSWYLEFAFAFSTSSAPFRPMLSLYESNGSMTPRKSRLCGTMALPSPWPYYLLPCICVPSFAIGRSVSATL